MQAEQAPQQTGDPSQGHPGPGQRWKARDLGGARLFQVQKPGLVGGGVQLGSRPAKQAWGSGPGRRLLDGISGPPHWLAQNGGVEVEARRGAMAKAGDQSARARCRLPCLLREGRGLRASEEAPDLSGFLEPVPPRRPGQCRGAGRPTDTPSDARLTTGSGTAPVSTTTAGKQTRRRVILRPQEMGRAFPRQPRGWGALCPGRGRARLP